MSKKKQITVLFSARAYDWKSGDDVDAVLTVYLKDFNELIRKDIIPSGPLYNFRKGSEGPYHLSWFTTIRHELFNKTVDKKIDVLLNEK